MRFMNTYEIDEACARWRTHSVLGPATQTLANLRDATDAHSDGWAYWPKPVRAAGPLMEMVEEANRAYYRGGGVDDIATPARLKVAYRALKSFRTRQRLDFTIAETHQESMF